jgi:hypothetical protein
MPHQQKAIDEMSDGKILYGDVGTGKSLTALGYYMQKAAPLPLLIVTTARKRDTLDWEGEGAKYGIFTRHGDAVAGKMTVISWNQIHKYADIKGHFVILDEQRLVGSGKWVKSFLKMAPNNRWILLSGTPGDTWMDYAPVFIANGHFKNRSQFLQEHVVFARYSKFPKVERYVGIDKLERLRADILVHMPMDRHTTRLTHFIPVKFDEDRLRVVTRDRWNEFKDRPIESLPEFFYLMRKVVNSHASRLSAVRALMKMHPRLVVFYNFDYELEALRTLEDEGVAMAEWNGHKHETIPETDKWLYFVQYTAGSEGWNCTETDATVFYSLTYSYRQWYQAHGRIDRLNTKFRFLHYYVLLSEAKIDQGINGALSQKHSFNESAYSLERVKKKPRMKVPIGVGTT